MKRIVHVIADGKPGGGTTNVLALLEDLRARGSVEVAVVCDASSYLEEEARRLGVETIGLRFFRGRLSPWTILALRRALIRFQPALVHAHGSRAGFQTACALLGTDLRFVYTVRGYHFLGKPRWLRGLAALAESWASHRATVTVHVCEHDRRVALQRGLLPRRDGHVVHNGVRLEDYGCYPPHPSRLVAFLGRLTHQKDPLLFVEMAARLAPEGYAFRMIGGGELEDLVRARVHALGLERGVELLGSRSREEARRALSEAGVLVCTSRWEGLPLAPIEAMAMGIPVVAADVSGVPEVVRGEETGLLVRGRDPAAFAAAVRRMTEDEELSSRIIPQARELVRTCFVRSRCMEQYERIYEKLLS